ncbi:ATPase [Methanococcoides methylutens]|uniref:ATPase n=1 Tax=Methanococcoides methylutens TaxID=2226 RepID=A0A099T267_METMT|nr:ATP-binding protein [Methanococcoides methylutens]KGK99265.1 ATPase [Methanococcoides methylutens]
MINDTDLLAYASESDLSDEDATKLISENRATAKAPEFEEYDVGASFDLNTGDADNAFGIITTGFDPLEVTESGSRIAGYITTDHRSQVRLGTYVIVPYENEHLFARIWKLQYQQQFEVDDATEIHSRRMLRSNTTAELDYKFLAYLDPICILYEHVPGDESSLVRRMADRIPRPNTPILPVTEKLKIQTGLNIPREGIFLGHLSVGGELVRTHASPPTVPYYLRNDYSMGDPLIFRHMLVCGSTGTGKTFLTKNILRQFMSEGNRYQVRDNGDGVKKNKNPCLVIMDPQDEYSQLLEDNPDLVSSDEHDMNSESVKFGGVPSTKTFVANVDGQNYNGRSRAEQAEFTIPFEMVRSNSWLIAAAGLTELQGIALELLLEDYFKRPGKHTYNGFMEHIDDAGVRGTYVDNGKIHEASYDGIVRKVRNQAFRRVFDQPATPITEMLADIFKAGQICVFPTEYISNTRIRDLITLTLMTIVVDNKLNTSGDALVKETPIILVLDEAHRYLAKGAGEHSKRIISKFADAARQGRKEGLGLFLITQDPQDIDETVFKQVNSRVILNLSNDAAISAMKVKKEYEKRIPYLKKGQMIIQSPDNSDVVEVIGLSKCVVKHV